MPVVRSVFVHVDDRDLRSKCDGLRPDYEGGGRGRPIQLGLRVGSDPDLEQGGVRPGCDGQRLDDAGGADAPCRARGAA